MSGSPQLSAAVSAFFTDFLKEHFGEAPETVSVLFHSPFLLFHVNSFAAPSEKMLIKRGETNRVLKTRQLLWNSLQHELVTGLRKITGKQAEEVYTDWRPENGSGLVLVVLETENPPSELPWPTGSDEQAVKEIINMNSTITQKKPDQTVYFWLQDDVVLIRRSGILVEVEKQLVKNGVTEELRLAKRPLEERIRELFNLDAFLPSGVAELFVDWDFHRDLSYMVLVLNPSSSAS